jgi:hypothetical protein
VKSPSLFDELDRPPPGMRQVDPRAAATEVSARKAAERPHRAQAEELTRKPMAQWPSGLRVYLRRRVARDGWSRSPSTVSIIEAWLGGDWIEGPPEEKEPPWNERPSPPTCAD